MLPGLLKKYASLLLLAPAILLLSVMFIWPVLQLIGESVRGVDGPWTHYSRLVEISTYYRIMLRTLLVSLGTALICFTIGYPLAYKLTISGPGIKALILVCIFVPFWTNLLVRSYGWIIILNPQGLINSTLLNLGLISTPLELVYNTTGVLIGMTQIMLPYMVLPLYAVMSRIDPSINNAARSLGARPLAAFARVYFPLTLPGAMAGTLLVFTISLGFFVIPAILGGTSGLLLAQLIEFNINRVLNWGMAAALSTSLLVVTLVLYWASDRWFKLGAIWGLER